MSNSLSKSTLLKLRRWNTPTIYNGWEAITSHDRMEGNFNVDETRDYMPHMGPMVGYAVTMVTEPSNPSHMENKQAWKEYLSYVAGLKGPKIAVIQDLDAPNIVGSIFGEVVSSIHKALGCVGVIVDGAIRDIDEMNVLGLKALARRLCVGHGYAHPVRWNCEVTAFGCKVNSGNLVHADKHGFIVIPPEDEERLLEASLLLEDSECDSMIQAARFTEGDTVDRILEDFNAAMVKHGEMIKVTEQKFRSGR